jgi:hypothetical protein
MIFFTYRQTVIGNNYLKIFGESLRDPFYKKGLSRFSTPRFTNILFFSNPSIQACDGLLHVRSRPINPAASGALGKAVLGSVGVWRHPVLDGGFFHRRYYFITQQATGKRRGGEVERFHGLPELIPDMIMFDKQVPAAESSPYQKGVPSQDDPVFGVGAP